MSIEIENYRYDAEACVGCKGCIWVDHVYMPGIDFSTKCPSITKYEFDAYSALGRERVALGLMDKRLEYSSRVLDIIYKCQLCGACDSGCKRNLDLEPLLVLEGLRMKCVRDGEGPMPEHQKVSNRIVTTGNYYGINNKLRSEWIPEEYKKTQQANTLYFVGCNSSFKHNEIALATAKILNSAEEDFMFMMDEKCCGHPLYVVGQLSEAKKIAENNLRQFRELGVKTILVSCAECYKTFKVDYPKMLKMSTIDLGFDVIHIAEYAAQLLKKKELSPNRRVNMKAAYHDPCNLGRLSEPWVHWEGKRTKYGVYDPDREVRRGTFGIYQPPRDILGTIPGLEIMEMIRNKENALCCGAGGGVLAQYPDFATWTANQRLLEAQNIGCEALITACPWCKENLSSTAEKEARGISVYDISEILALAL